jgi:hypothetical protein
LKKDIIVLNLPDAFTNPGAMHVDSFYIRKQASGKKKGRSPAFAGNGKLMERMRKQRRKDCIS